MLPEKSSPSLLHNYISIAKSQTLKLNLQNFFLKKPYLSPPPFNFTKLRNLRLARCAFDNYWPSARITAFEFQEHARLVAENAKLREQIAGLTTEVATLNVSFESHMQGCTMRVATPGECDADDSSHVVKTTLRAAALGFLGQDFEKMQVPPN